MAARRVQLGVAAGIVLVVAAALAILLLRDSAGGDPTPAPTQSIATQQDLDTLRAEAEAAARNLFAKIDQADATGRPELLDGLYTEGAKAVEDGQKQAVRKRLAEGVVSIRHSHLTEIRVEELTQDVATVRVTREVPASELRDARTGRLVEQRPGSVTPVLLVFERIDGRWLVAKLDVQET